MPCHIWSEGNPIMKTLISAALALALTVAGSPVRGAQEPTTCATPTPSEVQHFSGSLSTVTDPFVLPKGVYVVSAKHEGEHANFAVWVYDEAGERDLLFNELGVYEGETTLPVEAESKLILDISVDGPWTIDIKPAF
jgi:hypothetical protein